MLRSMTGFGKAEAIIGQKKFTAEVRSLNSKQLDFNLRMPGVYRDKEMDLRSWLSERILRGKADVLIYYESLEPEKRVSINLPLLESYYADLRQFADRSGIPSGDYLNALMRIPDVLKPENQEPDEQEWKQIEALVKDAYTRFNQYRCAEGSKLSADFSQRIALIRNLRNDLVEPIRLRRERMREKLNSSLLELVPPDKVDANRFEQEVIYYLERLDVSEELQRLLTNCEHFEEELQGDGQGKKLGFISQEIGREINTIGSKANDSDMQRIVVHMKDELEKIKEQINNVL
jgi:uncharacterized protein (TIGR00255 family)